MRRFERLAPAWPALARAVSGIEPFGQKRRARQSRLDGLLYNARRKPGGQAVNRLDEFHLGGFLGREDMVGMGDLNLVVEVLHLARDDALGAEREDFLEIIGLRVKEDEKEEAGLVAAEIGRAHV